MDNSKTMDNISYHIITELHNIYELVSNRTIQDYETTLYVTVN